MELERLSEVGGRDKIVPNEGIVFVQRIHDETYGYVRITQPNTWTF